MYHHSPCIVALPNKWLLPNCYRRDFQPFLAGGVVGKWVQPCQPAIG